jgi:hypothetical protein
MDSTARQARLKPEFAELYPPLKADVWEPAAEIGARVLLWQLQQQGTAALGVAGAGGSRPNSGLGSAILPSTGRCDRRLFAIRYSLFAIGCSLLRSSP